MFSIELARQYTQESQSNEFAVDFDLVWQWLGYSTKGNAKKKFEKAGFIESIDFSIIIQNDNNPNQAGAPTHHINLTIDCVKHFAMMANTEQGKLVRKYFIEAEKELRRPKSALELAREQVKLLEQIELQEAQIKLLEEDNQRQSEIIDELFDYSSIIRIAKYNNVSETLFNWRVLKAASIQQGIEIKTAPDARFGVKNLYHHNIFRYCYPEYRLPETTTLVIHQ